MGKSIIEKLESIRNIRFSYRMKNGIQKDVRFRDIVKICGGGDLNIPENRRVSFIGFFNEFDDVYGKDCVIYYDA